VLRKVLIMRRIVFVFLLVAALLAGSWGAFAFAARNPDGLALRELGQSAGEAYAFGFPIVLMDETRQTLLGSGEGIATNQLHHRRALPGYGDEAVVRPNRDTLYSLAWLDLAAGPAIVRFPETDGRYWLFQVMDAWTDVAGTAGSRLTGTAPGAVMIAGPGWDGPALPGMARIQVDTEMAWLLGRIAVAPDEADLQVGHALQDQFSLTAPAVSGPVSLALEPGLQAMRPPDRVAAMAPDAFFARLAALMADNPPRPGDDPMVDRLAALGVTPGDYDRSGFGPLARYAMARGVSVARERLVDAMAQRPFGPTQWRTALGLGDYGVDYGLRAGVALFGLGANLPADAIYPSTEIDSQGRPLTGAHAYKIRFAPDHIPPARSFWSVTAYDADGFLLNAPHHLLGDRDPVVRDEDGGLTLTISATRPQGVPEMNWLAVVEGAPFALTARLYDPEPEALSGDWRMPAVERIE
jgi:hypothetical protein